MLRSCARNKAVVISTNASSSVPCRGKGVHVWRMRALMAVPDTAQALSTKTGGSVPLNLYEIELQENFSNGQAVRNIRTPKLLFVSNWCLAGVGCTVGSGLVGPTAMQLRTVRGNEILKQ